MPKKLARICASVKNQTDPDTTHDRAKVNAAAILKISHAVAEKFNLFILIFSSSVLCAFSKHFWHQKETANATDPFLFTRQPFSFAIPTAWAAVSTAASRFATVSTQALQRRQEQQCSKQTQVVAWIFRSPAQGYFSARAWFRGRGGSARVSTQRGCQLDNWVSGARRLRSIGRQVPTDEGVAKTHASGR